MDITKTVYETVDDIAKGDIRKELRKVLGAFLFRGEDVDKKVAVLSGGERTRLALCQLLLSPSNFLILDEPTNHLDIQSKEVLKEALKNYEGTFIVVSHDREFLEGLTNRIWDIENQTLKIHHFGVKDFLKRKMELLMPESQKKKSLNPKKEKKEKKTSSENKNNYQDKKELKRERNKWNNQINSSEKKIEECEAKIAEMDVVMTTLDYSNSAKAGKALADYEALKNELDNQMKLWEEGTERLEAMDN